MIRFWENIIIILKTLKFSNPFSYGENNVIHFNTDAITQLVGKNGHGKSSIALILEECLFNKNSKGIKKADILNRHVKAKSYTISLTFSKDTDEYEISTTRGSTQTVTLLKNSENISAHTATATFKLIEDILGFDHKTFTQLVYQSNSASLEFLTATDTNRKKFLIDLLNLSKYLEAFEVFKAVSKQVSEDVAGLNGKITATKSWLDKNMAEDFTLKDEVEVPKAPETEEIRSAELQERLNSIDATNRKISKNNTYRAQLKAIDITEAMQAIPPVESSAEYQTSVGIHKKAILDSTALVTKMTKLGNTCPTCLQAVDKDQIQKLLDEQEQIKQDAEKALKLLNTKISEIDRVSKEATRITKLKNDWETYHSMVDEPLQEDPLDAEIIQKELDSLTLVITKAKKDIAGAIKANTSAAAHNSRIKVILEQAEGMRADLEVYQGQLAELNSRLSILQILQKTFSTNGLIAYKIECLVKDLEDLTNKYLAELSDGRFQLMFKVSTGDKLNVIISDNGKDIEIFALSGGERARVNTATLLAIRKIMQSLSNARINLLILDETISSLDDEGKERLIEVLLEEVYLNTFLVSHDYTHPLLEKIVVIKDTTNISRLE